jgi:NAD(P)-dependent dehydrogenase (short-subunit alcohol dehydrogenase family)
VVTEQSVGGRLHDLTVVITGAAGQIGSAVSRRLAAEGARLFLIDADRVQLEKLATSLDGAVVEAHPADVTDAPAWRSVAEAARLFAGGPVDGFFNNAGVGGPMAPIEQYDLDEFDRVLRVNVRGVFLGLKHMLPVLADGGSVVNSGSVASCVGSPGTVAYVASKHAVLGITRTAAAEQAHRRVRVNAVCPGPIEGQMMADFERGSGLTDPRPHFVRNIPFRRFGLAEEVAPVVAFLLAPESAYVTGASYVVDGGLTCI